MISDDESKPKPAADQAVAHSRADGADLIVSARDFIGGVLPAGIDSSGPPSLSRQEASLRRWAYDVGLLLKVDDLPDEVMRGGMEHDLYRDEDRIIKVTRNGVFGLSPGIDLALVASGRDSRRFHLWEATPLQYLERLHLQNMLVPGLNSLEGVIDQPDDLAIVISQPRFEIIPVTEEEIIAWFALQGFAKVTASGYYRAEDNLGVFDAHDKNVVRFENDLIPFDVIPVRPDGGFLSFIEDTLAAGHELREVRTVNRRGLE